MSARVLLVILLLAAGSAKALGAQSVSGRLVDSESGRPIVLGVVALLDTTRAIIDRTFTDERGRFTLETNRPGDYWVAASRTGYQPKVDGVLELGAGGSISVDFFLRPSPYVLDSLVVSAQRTRVARQLALQGFYERKSMGFGHFITPELLQRRTPLGTSDLLRGVAGVYTTTDGLGGTTVLMRNYGRGDPPYCTPRIYLDGVVVEGSVEQYVDVRELEAVEIYTRVAAAPIQYAGLNNCGVILFWTKQG